MTATLTPHRRGIGLVSVVLLAVLLVIVAANAVKAWTNHRLRDRIASELAKADAATKLVASNSARGLPLDFGWRVEPDSVGGARVTISPDTGIVTLAFPAEAASPARNLKLVPVTKGNVAKLAGKDPAVAPDWKQIKWVCTSRESRYSFTIPSDAIGTLPSRWAPAECR